MMMIRIVPMKMMIRVQGNDRYDFYVFCIACRLCFQYTTRYIFIVSVIKYGSLAESPQQQLEEKILLVLVWKLQSVCAAIDGF